MIDLDEARKELRIAGRRVTDHALGLAQKAGPGLDIDVHVELREPRSLLAEAATGAHLLVLGSRGHGAVLSLLLGSVSVALAAHAPCPVAVVRPAADDDATRSGGGRASTVRPDSAGALTFAFELASVQHRPLEVVHAAGEALAVPGPRPGRRRPGRGGHRRLAAAAGRVGGGLRREVPRCRVHQHRRAGLGRRRAGSRPPSTRRPSWSAPAGRSALTERLLGSVSRSVVEHAHCTVAVVRGAAS